MNNITEAKTHMPSDQEIARARKEAENASKIVVIDHIGVINPEKMNTLTDKIRKQREELLDNLGEIYKMEKIKEIYDAITTLKSVKI